jgi:hypothetical protein
MIVIGNAVVNAGEILYVAPFDRMAGSDSIRIGFKNGCVIETCGTFSHEDLIAEIEKRNTRKAAK